MSKMRLKLAESDEELSDLLGGDTGEGSDSATEPIVFSDNDAESGASSFGGVTVRSPDKRISQLGSATGTEPAGSTTPLCHCGRGCSVVGTGSSAYYTCGDKKCNYFVWASASSEQPGSPAKNRDPLGGQRNQYNQQFLDGRKRKFEYFTQRADRFACQQTVSAAIAPGSVGSSGSSGRAKAKPSSAGPATPEPVPVSAECNLNAHLTSVLAKLAELYKVDGDQWRVKACNTAIGALKRLKFRVVNVSQVRGIHGLGDSMINRIDEILRTGDLMMLSMRRNELRVLSLFSKVWGAGPKTVKSWFQLGYRTLDDLRQAASRGELTTQQQIGLQVYDDLQQRIPRSEVRRIEQVVAQTLLSLDSSFKLLTCGSYRRGKPDCGDVDILITHPDGKSHVGCLDPLVKKLHESQFLLYDLSFSHDEQAHSQTKYMGVCKLPNGSDSSRPSAAGKSLHRRLDLIAVPINELAFASLYFTGSDYFNRSMRHYAKKIGLTLTQHHLAPYDHTPHGKVLLGPPIPCSTEEEIFVKMKLEYVPPHLRDPSKA